MQLLKNNLVKVEQLLLGLWRLLRKLKLVKCIKV